MSDLPDAVALSNAGAADVEKQIVRLILLNARLSDEQKYLEWLDLFTEDGRYAGITNENYESTGLYLFKDKGKSAIHERVGFLKGLWQVPRGKTLHFVTNIEVAVDPSGETASATSYFLMSRTADMEHTTLHAAGRYFDKFSLIDGAWLFAERIAVVDSNMLPGEFTDLL